MTRNKNFKSDYLLYLVATPIGNLKDISERFKDVVSDADLVASEDTRNASSLLAKLGYKKQTISLREHNEKQASEVVISRILKGEKVIYMSDAGYPGISDPGRLLVEECVANNISVSVIPGPSAFISALVASNLDTDHFYFHGFLSPKEIEAKKELETLKEKEETLIFYESPHRIGTTLSTLYEILGNRKSTIVREITKLNEEYIYGTLEEFVNIDKTTLIGEMVIIVEGNKAPIEKSVEEIKSAIEILKSKNLTNKDISEIICKLYKVDKNYIKKLLFLEK